MGMVVRTNTMALNAYRQLGMNNSAVSKSLEKLSSGFRINRAGDDAAGLAISEKMKAQIKGLETASANAQDGISLIQTAEGNLNEVHDMLNRMVELAGKSANGTYTSQERKALQDEVNSLLSEIDRISQSANFNGTKLLNGTMGLNNEAIDIGASTGYVAAGDKAMTVNPLHASASGSEVVPEFTVDFADFSVEFAKAGGTDGTTKSGADVGLSIGGQAVKMWDGADSFDATLKSENSTANVGYTIDGAALKKLLTDAGRVQIGDYEYTVAAGTGTNAVKFTFAGKVEADPTNTPTDTKVPEDLEIPKGNLTVSLTNGVGDKTETNRIDCPVYDIKDPAAGGDPVRAGATTTLSAEMIKAGNTLTIGKTVFTFKEGKLPTTLADNSGANQDIYVDSSLSADEQMEMVTAQLSHMSAKIEKDVNGREKEFTFNIGRSADGKSIEIEEQVQADVADLGKFTADELKAAFKVSTQEAMASTEITLKDNDKLANKETILVDGKEIEFAKGKDTAETMANLQAKLSDYKVTVNGNKMTIAAKAADKAAPKIAGAGLTLQIGDTADSYNKMNVQVDDMSTTGLGINGLSIMNEVSASDAIDTIKNAINTVSNTRAGMGALQNRLEHTINNLDVAVENLSAANSRIRDTDMAKEMMNYTKMNVLVQSAQAMLAQANQQPQSVLQLLQ